MVELQNPDSRYVNGTLLLFDGEEGERSPFLELIKLQHLADCQATERAVLSCIDHQVQLAQAQALETASMMTGASGMGGASTGGGAGGGVVLNAGEIAISKLRDALVLADGNKTRTEVNQLLARGAGCTVEAVLLREAKRVPLVVEEFKSNICLGLLKKSPPPAPKKAKK